MKSPRRAEGASVGTSLRAHRRLVVFSVVLVAYIVVTLCVILPSPLLDLDHAIKQLHLQRKWDGWYPRIEVYVMLGQRGPATLVALPWIAYLAWRRRSPYPLVLLATALLVLNLSVGVVKVITGRIGPLETQDVHTVFAGGNIYPSGHVSNTVVLYGVLAMLATVHRRFAVIAAVWITLSVGLCTLYLNTHWFSDVVGGWLAGSLVVVALPWVTPYPERAAEALVAKLRRRRSTRALARSPQLGAAHVDPVTERPTEPPTELPTERPTERPTEPPTELPTTVRTPALSGRATSSRRSELSER